jgi:signal transduction histidine kinase/CheY-like chemotaxis protein
LGKNFLDFVPEEDRKGFTDRNLSLGDGATRPLESRIVRSDGEIRAVESIMSPTQFQGKPATIVVQRDVTESRRQQDHLVQSQKMEAVGQLAGGIAHDFNNLLTAIGGHAALSARATPDDHPAKEHLKKALGEVIRAASLTAQLLTFARRDMSRPEVTDLNELILNTAGLLHRLIGADIELVTQMSAETAVVQVDTQQIEQVLINMTVNARDAMPHGGKLTITTDNVLIEADSARDLPPGRYIKTTVSDTGVGVGAEICQHVFEPFFTTKAQGKGSGLGLAACYGMLKDTGGDIDVRSEPGRGTSFDLYVPAIDDKSTPSPSEDVVSKQPEGAKTVLLVDDEPSVRSLAAEVLRHEGYRVIEAANGEEALLVAASFPDDGIQLMLTDVVMPGMGGVELIERFSLGRPSASVIFTSGNADRLPLTTPAGKEIPFLPKPFRPDELANLVRETLGAVSPGKTPIR